MPPGKSIDYGFEVLNRLLELDEEHLINPLLLNCLQIFSFVNNHKRETYYLLCYEITNIFATEFQRLLDG